MLVARPLVAAVLTIVSRPLRLALDESKRDVRQEQRVDVIKKTLVSAYGSRPSLSLVIDPGTPSNAASEVADEV
jgi:hypothetical protein